MSNSQTSIFRNRCPPPNIIQKRVLMRRECLMLYTLNALREMFFECVVEMGDIHESSHYKENFQNNES
jgi:hypothetical protein